jgi:hypothetical protein
MKFRQLGLNAVEMEEGPFVFLLSHSIPVAYRDRRPDARAPGVFRTDRKFGKAVARHVNKWLEDKGPHSTVPHDLIVAALDGVGLYSSGGAAPTPPPEAIAGAFEYLANLARQGGAR